MNKLVSYGFAAIFVFLTLCPVFQGNEMDHSSMSHATSHGDHCCMSSSSALPAKNSNEVATISEEILVSWVHSIQTIKGIAQAPYRPPRV